MKGVLLVVVGSALLGGCAGVETYFDKDTGTQNIDSGTVNAFNPSASVLEVRRCNGAVIEPYTTSEEHDYGDGTKLIVEKHHPISCEGEWVNIATVPATQPGWATVWNGIVDGFFFVWGMDRLGDGIGDSGSTTNNTNGSTSNGGQTINSNANLNQAVSSSKSSAASKSISRSSSSAKGGSVNYGKHRR